MARGMVNRPAGGSATGRVWDIADELSRASGREARRADVIARYAAEGGNYNTASTQFHHWRNWFRSQNTVEERGPAVADIEVGEAGRIVLPAALRKQLDIRDGDVLTAEIVDGDIVLIPLASGIRKAQAIVRRYVPEGVHLVDELLEERKREAAREDRD